MQKGVSKYTFKRGVARKRKRVNRKIKVKHKRHKSSGFACPRQKNVKRGKHLPWRAHQKALLRESTERKMRVYSYVVGRKVHFGFRRCRGASLVGQWRWREFDGQWRWDWYPVPGSTHRPDGQWLYQHRPQPQDLREQVA